MEHEMRLAAFYHGLGPLVMPYCVGCGWVGKRRMTSSEKQVQSDLPAEWRTHIKEFKLMQHARERALIEDVEGSKR